MNDPPADGLANAKPKERFICVVDENAQIDVGAMHDADESDPRVFRRRR
jgi:hypothetical protein